MEMLTFERNMRKKGVDYVITCQVNKQAKIADITLETKNELKYWTYTLNQSEVKRITTKANSIREFEVFANMLISGMNDSEETISLDLLDYQDIEGIRRNNPKLKDSNASTMSSIPTDVRYLVVHMSYKYDNTRYPMRMPLNTQPSMEMLNRSFLRVRSQAAQAAVPSLNIEELEKLKAENLKLSNKIILLQNERQSGAVEQDNQFRELTKSNEELRNYKEEAQQKVALLSKTVEELKSKLKIYSKAPLNKVDLKEERDCFAEDLEHLEEDNNVLRKELKKAKDEIKQNKVKIKQLKDELEIADKRYKIAAFGSVKKGSVYSSNRSYKSVGSKKGTKPSYLKGTLSSNKSVKSAGSKKSGYSRASYESKYSKGSYNSKSSFRSNKFSVRSGGLYKKPISKPINNLNGLRNKKHKTLIPRSGSQSSNRSVGSNLKSKYSTVSRNYSKPWQVSSGTSTRQPSKKKEEVKAVKKKVDTSTRINKITSLIQKIKR